MKYLAKIYNNGMVTEIFSDSKNSRQILKDYGGQKCEVYSYSSGVKVGEYRIKTSNSNKKF